VIRDDLTPEQLAAVAAEGTRLAAAAAAAPKAETAQAEKPNMVANVQHEVREPVKAARNVTLVAMHHLEIEGRVFHHGAEIMPSLISTATLAKLIDQGRVREYDSRDRRSLYRLFSKFSGCKEKEPLTAEEMEAYSL
jgi:hypothetical protein